ncbi:MAG: DUF503 domain-containing protein [Candidatus Xenobia bacterium]
MVVAVSHLDVIFLSAPESLKEKRQVLRRIKDRVRNKFPVSIAEVGSHDLWQRGELGIAMVGTDARELEAIMASVHKFIESEGTLEIVEQSLDLEHH